MITRSSLRDVPLKDLIPYARNPRRNDPAVAAIARSLEEFGYVKVSVLVDENMVMLAGHTTLKAIKSLKWTTVPEVTKIDGLSDAQKMAYRLADNKLGELAEWDDATLLDELHELTIMDFDIEIAGFDPSEYLPESMRPGGGPSIEAARKSLAERFLIPPFSVLDARQGYWQERKRAWLALGIKSELGRGGNAEPGGSARPACDYSTNERGDGHGRPMKSKMAMHNDPMQRKEAYDAKA